MKKTLKGGLNIKRLFALLGSIVVSIILIFLAYFLNNEYLIPITNVVVFIILPALNIVANLYQIIDFLRSDAEKSKRRREHSIKLKEVLETWLADSSASVLGDIMPAQDLFDRFWSNPCLKPVSDDESKLGFLTLKDADYRFFRAVKSHLESGYPEILEKWDLLKTGYSKYNKKCLTSVKKLEKTLVKKARMPCFYWKGKVPERFITPNRLAELIYNELEWTIRTGRKQHIPKPSLQMRENFHQLNWGAFHSLVKSGNAKEIKRCGTIIEEQVESSENKEIVRSLLAEKQTLEEIHSIFQTKLEEVIDSVELGKDLKGKCKDCP